jgi:hypothetical protein
MNEAVKVQEQKTTEQQGAAKARKPRPKPQRLIRVCVRPSAGAPGVIRIKVGAEDAIDYLLRELPCEFGSRAWQLAKIGANAGKGETYAVLLDGQGGSCECRGYLRWGRCKHQDGLKVLAERGLL